MEDHIPRRPDKSLLLGGQTSEWSSWDFMISFWFVSSVLSSLSVPNLNLNL